MKLFLILMFAVVSLRLFVFWARQGAAVDFWRRYRKLPKPHPTYTALRDQALRFARAQIGFVPVATPTRPWGVIMDEGLDDRLMTIIVFADGSASVYSSVGGGAIGGQAHESIRSAAHQAVDAAAEIVQRAHRTTYFPVPKREQIFFYIRTDVGVFTARARRKDFCGRPHALKKLRVAMLDVLAKYRSGGSVPAEQ